MKKGRLNKMFLILMAFLAISCDKSQVFDEYKTLEDGWQKDSILNFAFDHEISKKPENLFINIRNNNDYPFSNLYLIVKLEQPKGKIKIDTLEYQMANPDGSLLGTGFSDIKESKLWYKEKFMFPEKGNYKISIQQAVRQNGKINGIEKLDGITEVGFRVESIEEKK